MLTQGFKNLIKSSTLLDESFQQLLKKSDDYRKCSKMSLDYAQMIFKLFEAYQSGFQKVFMESIVLMGPKELKDQMSSRQLFAVFQSAFSIQNKFAKSFSGSIRDAIETSNNLFKNYSNLIITFQCTIRTYVKHQQMLLDQSKRYFKNQKLLLQNLQSYKASFTDVKLIYNNDEKIKRYIACENSYKAMLEDLKIIEEKIAGANKIKRDIAEGYKNIEYEFVSALKIVGNRMITLAEFFVYEYKEMVGSLGSFLSGKSSQASKIKDNFTFALLEINQEYFSVQIQKQKCKRYPSFIVYSANIKPQFYSQLGRMYNNFIKSVSERIQNRKKSQKALFEFLVGYFKQYEKIVLVCLRDLINYYDKNKKKISQIYGLQHMSFLQTFSTIFERIIACGDILNKSISLRLKAIENVSQQSAKSMDGFLKEAKACLQKLSKKKQVKKASEQERIAQVESIRLDIQQKSAYLQSLIDSLLLKLGQNEAHLNIHCNAIITDMSGNALQLHEFCANFQQQQFDQSRFLEKYQTFQAQVDEIIKTKLTLFGDLSFASLRTEKDQLITFEPELNKVEEFKKIKKPAEYEAQKENFKRKQSADEKPNDPDKKTLETPKKASRQDAAEKSPEKSAERTEKEKVEKLEKYEQFLLSKTALQEGQKFVESFACGLSDKIILTGRLFITNQRLFFHSKFNPNNVFFGETFLQIPRKDILKVEKRQNAIIFNNSISVTTVNGQVFFTSFFSRNDAYRAICQALDINNEEIMFEPQEDIPQHQEEAEEAKEDDLREEQVAQRAISIDSIMETFDYIEIHTSQYTFPGLNAFKFFKLFDSNNEMTYNRKTFKGFNMYIKDLLEHRDIVSEQWTPELNSFLNSLNIKETTPVKFEKTITSIIPVANSGIPLMPKQAHLREHAKLYFYSKDKYVMVTRVENSGIPYCEYFNIKYKKVVETVAQNTCRFTLYYFIEFVQKTMMRSVIQSKSIEESKVTTSRLESEIRKYLKHLEKSKARNSQKEQKENWEERANELEKELQESKEREEKIDKEGNQSRQNARRYKSWFFYSLALNLLLAVVILSMY